MEERRVGMDGVLSMLIMGYAWGIEPRRNFLSSFLSHTPVLYSGITLEPP